MSRRPPPRGRSQAQSQRNRSRRNKPHRSTPIGPPLTLDITALGHDGRGISKHEGKVVFVAGALPGEQVEARVVQESSRFSEAQLVEVITPSEQRISPACSHFGQCGGCQLQHLAAPDQLQAKQQVVLDQLRRFASLVPEQLADPITAEAFGYRARARLGVSFNKLGEVTLGFRRAGDKQLVALVQCPVLQPSLQAVLAPLAQWLEQFNARAVSHVELVASTPCTLVLRLIRPLAAPALEALQNLADQNHWQVFLQPERDNKALTQISGTSVDPRLYYQLASARTQSSPLRVGYHPTDFTQVNPSLNAKMVAQVMDWLALRANERLWDLFCGVGNFTLPAAQYAASVVGVEAIEAMVVRCRENARANQLDNIEFVAADLTQSSIDRLVQKVGRPDAILLDPPRDGAREVCEQLGTLKRARIVYVSCNPATFARDARILVDQGYRLQRFGVMEMFPQTSHLETMALLSKGC
ncbi:23S rRNA (uracil(1939)-C(5))-methyltransferase RlmD [Gilvimarinus agarilyticus]|uniref:23S rRNA (uracil(1939)-C(5))-methyltransferase RlmD n=1 Tax=Gilvimarinus agarilyticus TaxID=679259 RepID=UPI0006964665|nr:23S rRNA (uracil(1939)-C(5))-methyltransferase RlmD [Gilvimarinus agarilyticus]